MAYIYTYVDLNNIIQETSDDVLNFAGNWVSTAQYFEGDVVLYNTNRYIALTASQGSTPPITLVRDTKWSVLTLVSSGTLTTTGSEATDAYSLAYSAYNIAVYGTEVAEAAYGLAHYAISIAGTAAGGGGDDSLARLALETAWTGTLAGNQAYNVAQDAYRIAVAGTTAVASLIDTILTTVSGDVVVDSSGNVVTSGGY